MNLSLSCVRLDPDCGDIVDRLHVTDISRGGLGAITDRIYYPGQQIMLCLPLTESQGRRAIHATVVRCRPRPEGYQIGIEFDAIAFSAWTGSAQDTAAAA